MGDERAFYPAEERGNSNLMNSSSGAFFHKINSGIRGVNILLGSRAGGEALKGGGGMHAGSVGLEQRPGCVAEGARVCFPGKEGKKKGEKQKKKTAKAGGGKAPGDAGASHPMGLGGGWRGSPEPEHVPSKKCSLLI